MRGDVFFNVFTFRKEVKLIFENIYFYEEKLYLNLCKVFFFFLIRLCRILRWGGGFGGLRMCVMENGSWGVSFVALGSLNLCCVV